MHEGWLGVEGRCVGSPQDESGERNLCGSATGSQAAAMGRVDVHGGGGLY